LDEIMNQPTAIFYEANAGTGKTRTLTGYILERVKQGMSLDRICALTFTDKAANEMLDRLRSRVAELVADEVLEPSQMQMAGKCFIGTIHAFCLQLVKRYSPELSLPPIFDIDPQEEKFQALFENRWDEFLSRLLASQAPADQAIIHSLGVTTLRALAEELVKTRYDFQLGSDDLRWLADDLANARKWNFNRKGTWGEFGSRLVRDFESHRDVLSAMVQMGKPNSPWRMQVKDLLACKNIDLHRAVILLKHRFTKPFLDEYHGSGYVLYDDLLRFARKLLNDRRIRSEMKERYDLVLVDEMQDTDAVQYEIILYLCEKKELHQNLTLREVYDGAGKFELEPDKLFVVGDPKQSIYGFRNADLSAYESVKTVLQNSGADVRPLSDNYRSCTNLVEFSNVLAANLFPEMRPHDSKAAQAGFCPERKLDECVHLVKIYSADDERLHLRILSEANWIARKIRQLVDSGTASFKDFGVLLRKLVHSHLYVDALSAQDIPVIIEGERFFYRSQEVIDFINLLKFIVDEKDEVALAGLLRSPLFAMTDRECALFFHAYRENGRMVPEAMSTSSAGGTPAVHRLQLMERIFEIRKQIHLLSPASLIDLTLKKLPVLTVAGLAYGSYRSTLAPLNILRIHKYAVELEVDPAYNLFHFVSMLTEFSREGKERGQEPLADEGLDAVRMMSIHNSKGLDFPIVFVPLTDYEIRSSAYAFTEIVHDWATGNAGLKINGVTEASYLKLKYGAGTLSAEEPVLEEEEKRVLYVAATRAKKEIYFCCLENGSGKDVMRLLQNMFPFLQVKEESSSSALQQLANEFATTNEPLQSVLDQWRRVQDSSLLRAGVLVDSVTNEAEKLEPGEEELAQIAARAKRSGGTLVGLLCHGALEKWDFATLGDLDHLLRMEKGKYSRNFSKNQIDRAAEASNQILRRFVDSAAAQWLSTVEIVGREVPIVYFDRQSRKILSGKIDLLVKDCDKYLIVDYKTDVSLTESMRKRYAEQMRLYALALSESMAGSISSKLLFVRTGEIIDVL
jgi:ATP-dependent helicase/nuclease subunit A